MLEERIGQWRSYVLRRQTIDAKDVDELEDHLRTQVADLREAGLDVDEAFLIAVKRLGDLDSLSREYAREYSERLWKRLVVAPEAGESGAEWTKEALVAVGLAVAAGVAIKVPELFGMKLDAPDPLSENPSFYARNLSLFVLPFLAGFFAWKRRLEPADRLWLAAPFVVAALVVNLLPFTPLGHTEMLAALHLPMALWLTVGVAYAGGRWRDHQQRMNYVRFSGEWFIYYALIAAGGGVLMGITLVYLHCHRPGRGVAPQFVDAPLRRHGRRRHRRLAGGGQAERHREYGPGTHDALHAALHPDALGVPGHHGVDGERDQRGAGGAHRFRPAPGRGGGPAALRHLGEGSPEGARLLRWSAAPAGRLRAPGGRPGPLGNRGPHLRVRVQPQQGRRPG